MEEQIVFLVLGFVIILSFIIIWLITKEKRIKDLKCPNGHKIVYNDDGSWDCINPDCEYGD